MHFLSTFLPTNDPCRLHLASLRMIADSERSLQSWSSAWRCHWRVGWMELDRRCHRSRTRYGMEYEQRFFSRVANEGSDSTGICFSLCPQSLLLITGSLLEKRVMRITQRFSINKTDLNSSLNRTRERRLAHMNANDSTNNDHSATWNTIHWNTITRNRNQKNVCHSRPSLSRDSVHSEHPHSSESAWNEA